MFQKFLFTRTFTAVLFAFVFSLSPIYAAPGDLDPTFGNGGTVVTPVTPNDDNAIRVRIQSDGKIVTLGFAVDVNFDLTDYFIVRHNPDGTLDHSFGINGLVVINFIGEEFFSDFVILPDNKLLVAGTKFNQVGGLDFAVFRYLTNGTRDTAFGTNGVLTTSVGELPTTTNIARSPDGKFVVSGLLFDKDFSAEVIAVRYNADGTPDTTFGTGGITQTAVGESVLNIRETIISADGKMLIAGHASFDGDIDFFVLRYNADGTLDNSFGTGGVAQTDIDGQPNIVGGMALQSDGKIIVNGVNLTLTFDALLSSIIVRYNPDGTLDDTFGRHGIVRIFEPIHDSAGIGIALAIQPNDKILTAGIHNGTFAISRYNPNGMLDTSFGNGGGVVTTLGDNPGFDRILALAVQSDGNIVAAGGVNDADFLFDVGLVRYLGN